MQPCKGNIAAFFGSDLVRQGVWLPQLLLRHYKDMGISDREMMALIHVFDFISTGVDIFTTEAVAEHMEAAPHEVQDLMTSLSQKGFLKLESRFNPAPGFSISLDGLFDRLLEIWGCSKALEMEKRQSESKKADLSGRKTRSKAVSNLYCCFEKEFGRPLSPMESTQIVEWYQGDGYSPELVLEALKRAVLRGKVNFKYIDSILRDWARNNIRTIREVLSHEETFSENRKEKGTGKQKNSSDDFSTLKTKYKDIYVT